MSYIKAEKILPPELLHEVQRYVDGESIYIPRISGRKKVWGSATSTRQELRARNEAIYREYCAGQRTGALAEKHFLSVKSIQRIIRQMKNDLSPLKRAGS